MFRRAQLPNSECMSRGRQSLGTRRERGAAEAPGALRLSAAGERGRRAEAEAREGLWVAEPEAEACDGPGGGG
jgi:hypothetical protein